MKLISLAFFVSFFFSVLSCTEDAPRYWDDNTILLNMINKRLEVAPLVAKSKWNTKLPIDDPDREKVILDSVESKAKNLGVDKNFALYFFKAQFEAGKIVQRQLHEKWEIEHQPPFDPVPDLSLEVRPILDSLTPLLLMELKKIKPNSLDKYSERRLWENARKIIKKEFDNNVVKTAILPIENYRKKITTMD